MADGGCSKVLDELLEVCFTVYHEPIRVLIPILVIVAHFGLECSSNNAWNLSSCEALNFYIWLKGPVGHEIMKIPSLIGRQR